MPSLSDKAGVLIASNFVKYAVGFVMPMVLVRMLTKHDYGTLQQLQLIASTAVGVLVLGLPGSVYYFYKDDHEYSRVALVQQTLALLALSGAVTTVALVVFAGQISDWMSNALLLRYLPFFALSVGLSIADEHFVPFMIAQNRYLAAVLFETGETMVRVLVSVLPLIAGFGLTGLLICVVALSLTRALVRNGLLLHGIGWRLRPNQGRSFVREQLAYSIPTSLTNLTSLLGGALDRMIISTNFSTTQYAIYSVGALQIPLDVIFQGAVANVLRASLPGMIRDGQFAEIVRLLRESTRRLSMFMLPSFVFLLGFSHEFITLLFTKSYAGSVTVFEIYVWMIPASMFILSSIPQSFGHTKSNLYIVAAGNAFHIFASFALLKWVGYLGPAISMVATTYLIIAAYFMLATRLLKTSPLKLFPLDAAVRVTAAALLALLISKASFGGTDITLLRMVLGGALFSISYLVAAVVLRVFTSRDLALIRRWIGPFGAGK